MTPEFGMVARNPENGLTVMWIADDYEKLTLSWAMAMILVDSDKSRTIRYGVGEVHPFVWAWEGWEWL